MPSQSMRSGSSNVEVMSVELPRPGQWWIHQKTGEVYQIVAIVRLEKTQELYVHYQNMKSGPWARPLNEFVQLVPQIEAMGFGERFIRSEEKA